MDRNATDEQLLALAKANAAKAIASLKPHAAELAGRGDMPEGLALMQEAARAADEVLRLLPEPGELSTAPIGTNHD